MSAIAIDSGERPVGVLPTSVAPPRPSPRKSVI
jgi:hypothetical protein